MYLFRSYIRAFGCAIALLVQFGCATETSAVFRSLQYAFNRDVDSSSAALNPNFKYLRASVDGRIVLLALGYVEPKPDGDIEVWYSADREVVRLQNGRIVGTVGFTPEWREVSARGVPSWSKLLDGDDSVEWTRTRDVMPGYQIGIPDRLITRRTSLVGRTSLLGSEAGKFTWFEDIRLPDVSGGINAIISAGFENYTELPPARYAVSVAGETVTVVYGEQCLSRTFCFAWQRWPQSSSSDSARVR